VTGGYGWLAILAPLLLAAPGYFGGTLTLGGLMMVVGGFYQVQQALRWYVDRFPVIAEWRAMLTRVAGYRNALEQLETLGSDVGFITYEKDASGSLSFDNVTVLGPHGRIELNEPHIKISPGERVLIEATPKSGKSLFVKAIAGAWHWGKGSISLPPREQTMLLPQVPYIPSGTLRAALAYPHAASAFSDDEIHKALERVKIGRVRGGIDVVNRWDKELTIDEQRRLVLGRILLHRPRWLIQDESMSELDEESRALAMSIFANELAETAVISIGRHDPSHEFYQRRYSLKTRLPGLRLPLHFQTEAQPRPLPHGLSHEKVASQS
jgi:putative ATP-binding cassette transporter